VVLGAVSAVGALFALVACGAKARSQVSGAAASTTPPTLDDVDRHLGDRFGDPVTAHEEDEQRGIAAAIAGGVRQAFAAAADAGHPVAHRDAHAKHNGCLFAQVTVEHDLPAALARGIFVPDTRYDAIVRFSNGSGPDPKTGALKPDTTPDGHALTLKVLGVPGEKILPGEKDAQTQDFLMINYPVFFVRNVSDYVTFLASPAAFFADPKHAHEAEISRTSLARPIVTPLDQSYYSMTPYLLGDAAVKVSARSRACDPTRVADEPAGPRALPPPPDVASLAPEIKDNYLRNALRVQLTQAGACFDLFVQPQMEANPGDMPVNDPTIAWSEKASPPVRVATIAIPPHPAVAFDVGSEADTFCENLSYTPWHALPDHRPLGGINRTRKVVYDTISSLRHELNDVERREPTADDARAALLGR
jgi:hypothetical protein